MAAAAILNLFFVHFGKMAYFRWQLSTLLLNFIYLRHSALNAYSVPQIRFLESFDPQTLFFIIKTFKGTTLHGSTRFEP